MAKKAKSNKDIWFYAVRGSYLPCAPLGWYVYFIFLFTVVMQAILSYDMVINHDINPYVEVFRYLLFLLLGYYILTSIARKHSR